MTEKERYTLHQNGNYHTVIDEEENVPMIMIEFKENEFPVYACFHRIIDLLNEQDSRIKYLEWKLERERCATQKQHLKWSKQAEERIKELEYELNAFKPVVFQDMRKGTILLYAKDYGDVE